MTLNAGIILSGQQPNIVNTLAQSTQAAALQNANQRENALAQALQANGAGIVSGDANALSELARFDPQMAVSIQNSNRSQDRADAQFDFQRNQAAQSMQLQVMQYKQSISAAEAKAQAERIKQGVFAASSARTPEEWDAIVQQFGETDLVGQFENREAWLRQYMTAAQILAADEPEGPQSSQGKLFADLQAGLITPEQFEAANAKQGLRVTSDGQGGFSIEQGAGVTTNAPPKLSVEQGKNTGFLIRTRDANETLTALEEQGTRFGQQALGSVPFGLGNFLRDEDFQKFDQARRDFVNAILRRESGAVISPAEFENANQQYFPVPGDGDEVIAQKRRNRENAIKGLEVGSGEGKSFIDQQNQIPEVPDFSAMSDEELDAYIAEREAR